MTRTTSLTTLALLALAGCVGRLDAGPRSGGPGPRGPGTGPTPLPASCVESDVGFDPMTRLTAREHERTVRDLLRASDLGEAPPVTDGFPGDPTLEGTHITTGGTTSPLLVDAQLEAAETIGAIVGAEADAALACGGGTTRACVEDFARSFGRRAWRRALTDDEVARLLALYDEGAGEGGEDAGLELLVTGLLAAPWFLYHVEAQADDEPGAVRNADGFVLASRLSYFLWGSMPDDALLDAAEGGRLARTDDVEREVRRMMDDERAREGVAEFFASWLGTELITGITRDEEVYPEASAELAGSLQRSTDAFLSWAFWEEGSFDGLFASDVVFLDARLAPLFAASVSGSGMEAVHLPADERAGLLTQPGLLALLSKNDGSSPIRRGVFVRQAILCHDLPAPPNDVDLVVAPPSPGLSTRERFAEHTASPACASCHDLIDPVGFALEGYDALGRYRETDQGVAIDTTGEVIGTRDADGAVDGAIELAQRLARSEQVRDCYVEQWARYALRRPTTREEQCTVSHVAADFEASGRDLRELPVALATSRLLTQRRVAADAFAP